jgi:predicted permease
MTAWQAGSAAALSGLPLQLWQIFYFVVLPMLLLASLGYLIQRRLGLDAATLSRLNFYFVIPAVVYFSVVTSRLGAGEVALIVLFHVLLMACLAAVTVVAALVSGVERGQQNALVMTSIFYNSGNYGLPLQDLAFRGRGLSAEAMLAQALAMIVQNVACFTVGVVLAAGGCKDRHWKQNLLHIVRLPPLYALAAALLTVQARSWLGDHAGSVGDALAPFWEVVVYVRNAFIAVAVCTLGAELARVRQDGVNHPIRLSVVLRLLISPVIGLGLIWLLGIKGFLAQVLLISATPPTSVNCMLLCMEFRNHPDFAARTVLYSTLLSPITVTLVIFLAQGDFLPAFALP